MRRVPVLICALALACAACSSQAPAPTGSEPSPVHSPPSSTGLPAGPTGVSETTGTATGPSGSPAPPPDANLPGGMSPLVDDPADVAAIAAGDYSSLVPPGSTPATTTTLFMPEAPIDRIGLAWHAGATPGRAGLIVWQRAPGDPAWRAVFAFTDPAGKGVFGIRMEQGDVTRDGIPDLLSFEDVGGSGACGTYRVIAWSEGDASQILRRDVCDTEIQIAAGKLRVREAVFEPDDPHCCPSAFRTTLLRWNGSDWEEVSSEVSPAPGTG